MSGDQTASPNPTMDPHQRLQMILNPGGTMTKDPYQRLQIVLNPDGTMTRLKTPETPPTSDPSPGIPVLSKDIPINQSNNTWVRLFLPREAFDNSPTKLPLVLYYHGGGFILFSAASSLFHDFCVNMATELRVIIASIEYRLAPEHRLPAAYDDAVEALHWIKTAQDDWLRKYADFSTCFIMGFSAGGSIAYHAGLRAAASADHLNPLKIRGLILQQPFFGGIPRTGSELTHINDLVLPPCITDLMWELSLPIGVDRDHEYCNAMVGGGSKLLEKIKAVGWRIFVSGCDGDTLFDRQVEFVKMCEQKGVHVSGHFGVGGFHGVEYDDPTKAKAWFRIVKDFISSC
ncbi:carboxylesterase 1-like [Corylus avellana]|uniref:carboxylesterase 1-like n=1 Tax=Corylus avellana TaxID=13451 RepID=UPI001E1F4B17|nr:carboxylesterase 1-like [Corylus avellana]